MRFPARQTQFTSFYFEFPLALKDNFLLSALGTAVCFNSCSVVTLSRNAFHLYLRFCRINLCVIYLFPKTLKFVDVELK